MDRPLDTTPGQAVYSGGILAVYNTAVLRVVQPLAWRCPARYIVGMYDDNVTDDHLDVGVGTGYLLDRCRFPGPRPRITLLDLNPRSLAWAARRLRRYRPAVVRADILDQVDLPDASFGSVGMNCLLHCLPGRLPTDKAPALATAHRLLRPGGVLFGTTVLVSGVRHNAFGRRVYASWNRRGIWSNLDDGLDGLCAALDAQFDRFEVTLRGRSAMFRAWR